MLNRVILLQTYKCLTPSLSPSCLPCLYTSLSLFHVFLAISALLIYLESFSPRLAFLLHLQFLLLKYECLPPSLLSRRVSHTYLDSFPLFSFIILPSLFLPFSPTLFHSRTAIYKRATLYKRVSAVWWP